MTCNYTALVGFETAKRLKEAGYTKDYGYQYDTDGKLTDPAAPGGYEGVCEAPTYAEIFDWLMEMGLEISVHHGMRGYHYHIGYGTGESRFDTWPEAATAAIEKALEILEERK